MITCVMRGYPEMLFRYPLPLREDEKYLYRALRLVVVNDVARDYGNAAFFRANTKKLMESIDDFKN